MEKCLEREESAYSSTIRATEKNQMKKEKKVHKVDNKK